MVQQLGNLHSEPQQKWREKPTLSSAFKIHRAFRRSSTCLHMARFTSKSFFLSTQTSHPHPFNRPFFSCRGPSVAPGAARDGHPLNGRNLWELLVQQTTGRSTQRGRWGRCGSCLGSVPRAPSVAGRQAWLDFITKKLVVLVLVQVWRVGDLTS